MDEAAGSTRARDAGGGGGHPSVRGALAARGHPLRLLVRKGSDRRNVEGIEAELAEGDLLDPASLARAVEGCRYVAHVAADYRLPALGATVDEALARGVEAKAVWQAVVAEFDAPAGLR